jgi:ATP-dependent RNA helicase DDX21
LIREKGLLYRIEQSTNIKFKQVGAPQPSDIISASARDSSQSFGKVNKEVLHFFKDTARDLIDKYSSEEALCRALAIISGYTKTLKQKSLLTSLEGMVTLKLTGRIRGISGGSYAVYRLMKEFLRPDLVGSIKSMRIMRSEEGVVFDVFEKHKEEFLKAKETFMEQEKLELGLCETLPELKEVGYSGGYGRNGGGYGRNGGGYGRNRGGYGRNGGGYGGRNGGGYGRNGGGYGGRNGGGYGGRNGGGYGDRGGYGNSSSNFGGNDGSSRKFFNSNKSQGNGNSWGSDKRGGSGFGKRNGGGYGSDSKDKMKLFVGNLPFDIRESKFEEWIKSRKVNFKDSYLVKDHDGNCRGFGYIKFDSPSSTQEALKNLNNCFINDRRIKIDYATEKNN